MGGVGQFYRASLKHINKDALPHIKYYRHVFAASICGTPATKCEMADHPHRKDLLQRIGVPGCPVHRAGVPCLAILLIPAVVRAMDHYVNRFVRGFRPWARWRIASARFDLPRLRMRRIIRPRVVVPAIPSAPNATHCVATIAHLAFSLAGTILIPDCAPPQRLSPALFPQPPPAPIHSSGRSRP